MVISEGGGRRWRSQANLAPSSGLSATLDSTKIPPKAPKTLLNSPKPQQASPLPLAEM